MTTGRLGFLARVAPNPPRLSPGEPVILYGAGNVGKELATVLTKRGISVVCLLDRAAPVGATVDGIPILRPDSTNIDRSRHSVIISIFNRDVSIPDLLDDLHRQGFASVRTLLDVYDELWDEMGDRYWLGSRMQYRTARAAIEEVSTLWADEQSCNLFERIVRFRVTGDYRLLPPIEANAYFPDTTPPWTEPLRLVDGGAYDGDTLRALLESGHRVAGLAAFEPDSVNFSKLAACVRGLRGKIGDDVSLYPCGLWSRTEQVGFACDQGEASCIADGGTTVIQCVRLDDAVPSFAPTLVKLDVEGAENEALDGAADTIREYIPGLAVCLYHRPEDLWTIPLQVRALSERYRLYLRCHAHSGFELVLYGVPE